MESVKHPVIQDKEFSELVLNLKIGQSFAVAVSGGSDSMALALLAKQYAKSADKSMIALIVDHKLRKESSSEAIKVSKLLEKRKISSQILVWKHLKTPRNIQASARKERYRLLIEECVKRGIPDLIFGHHMEDQMENFAIRLSRGSGLQGLSGMRRISKYKDTNVRILRPLLNISKERLKKTLQSRFDAIWVEDPSNQESKYTRVRMRGLFKDFELEGFSKKRFFRTIENLARASDAIDFFSLKAIRKFSEINREGNFIISLDILSYPEEIILRSLSKILMAVGGREYTPRFEALHRLYTEIKKGKMPNYTLSGCCIKITSDNKMYVTKELRGRSSLNRVHECDSPKSGLETYKGSITEKN